MIANVIDSANWCHAVGVAGSEGIESIGMMQQPRLGTLRRIDARTIWKSEPQDFTPWLKDNIQLLSAALGFDLDLVEAEVRIGPFAADLIARDASHDRLVVIENQLTPTDHGHLGQILMYGASKQASVFVWIAPEFREEHRAALDWLNEHTDDGSLFFGVVVELLAVDDSVPAPNFRLVSFPNDVVKGRDTQVTEKGTAYAAFFRELLTEFKERYPGETNTAPRESNDSSLGLAIGRSGFGTKWAYTADRRFRIHLWIDVGDKDKNEAYLEQLMGLKTSIEHQMGHSLEWDPLHESRVCRVYSYYPTSASVLDDQTEQDELKEWAIDEMKKFRDVFRPLIRDLV